MTSEIHRLQASSPPPSRASNGGGNGNGFDARLRALEIQMGRIDERITAMQENMAKKNDVTNLKVWMLGGVLSGIILGVVIATTVVKAFF